MTQPIPSTVAAGADWHTLSASEAAARLAVDPSQGLAADETLARLARHGENRLAEKPPRSKWLALADQFKGLLILVLIGAAVLAGESQATEQPWPQATKRHVVDAVFLAA